MSDEPNGWERIAALAELGVMSASLLHELRASLFAAKGTLELAVARDQPLPADAARDVLGHLRDLDDLLSSWGGMGRVDEDSSRFDLNLPLERAIGLVEPRRRQVGASLEPALHPGPLWVHGRPNALRQVVVNVLHNALDAVENTGRRKVVSVATRIDGERIRLDVCDSGPGIPVEMRARLFEPFATSKEPGRGTGLGLYISRRLVEQAGGQLLLDDGEDGGTLVSVELPLAA
jgi:C4-dicarboxylate-specific signal transduction histidine kinase